MCILLCGFEREWILTTKTRETCGEAGNARVCPQGHERLGECPCIDCAHVYRLPRCENRGARLSATREKACDASDEHRPFRCFEMPLLIELRRLLRPRESRGL